ncbi:reverse transcriptase [Gossypium australe]|uniref:Reverse transcriptase n=1 Tax=Gossypium australe TaxID=47621 RepID=A0A5B6W5N1_9ROSI|nr:reverse transcriptase [Gossypium australe]
MGFDQNWIDSIMKCVSTVSYSVVLNGQAGDIFHPTRGLRQGDPLSPFLFLICREGLSCIMRLALRDGHLKGVKASRRGPQGSWFFKKILREYGTYSGQCVNFDKSTEEKRLVTRILGVRSSNDPERYLGLPNMRIDNWSIRHLSKGGKKGFFNAILQAILTYTMACFLLPKSLCVDLESIITKFWW